MILRINIDYIFKQQKPTDLYYGYARCLSSIGTGVLNIIYMMNFVLQRANRRLIRPHSNNIYCLIYQYSFQSLNEFSSEKKLKECEYHTVTWHIISILGIDSSRGIVCWRDMFHLVAPRDGWSNLSETVITVDGLRNYLKCKKYSDRYEVDENYR